MQSATSRISRFQVTTMPPSSLFEYVGTELLEFGFLFGRFPHPTFLPKPWINVCDVLVSEGKEDSTNWVRQKTNQD